MGVASICWGFLAHPPARGQASAVFDECLLGAGVDPRVDRLVANRVALGVGRSVHGGQCATRFGVQASADLAGRVPLRQISKYAAVKNRIAIQPSLLGGGAWLRGRPCRPPRPDTPHHGPHGGRSHAHHRRTTPNQTSDTRLGQTRLQPRHDRRAILDTKHPTTPHNQPPQASSLHENCLHPMTLPCYSYVRSLRSMAQLSIEEIGWASKSRSINVSISPSLFGSPIASSIVRRLVWRSQIKKPRSTTFNRCEF